MVIYHNDKFYEVVFSKLKKFMLPINTNYKNVIENNPIVKIYVREFLNIENEDKFKVKGDTVFY
jgi:hypothetical protein